MHSSTQNGIDFHDTPPPLQCIHTKWMPLLHDLPWIVMTTGQIITGSAPQYQTCWHHFDICWPALGPPLLVNGQAPSSESYDPPYCAGH